MSTMVCLILGDSLARKLDRSIRAILQGGKTFWTLKIFLTKVLVHENFQIYSTYMCVCTYIRMYLALDYNYVRTYIFLHVHTYVHACILSGILLRILIHTWCTYVHVHAYVVLAYDVGLQERTWSGGKDYTWWPERTAWPPQWTLPGDRGREEYELSRTGHWRRTRVCSYTIFLCVISVKGLYSLGWCVCSLFDDYIRMYVHVLYFMCMYVKDPCL